VLYVNRFVQRNFSQMAFSPGHEYGIDHHAINPRRESGIAAETPKAAKNLYECILHQVLGVGNVLRHQEAGGVHASAMKIEYCRTGFLVSILGSGNKFGVNFDLGAFGNRCGNSSASAHGQILSR
jgi:hypothetical protein